MPGPYIPDPTPAWLKPENASVTDSALTRAMRMIGHLIGADNPTAQVFGLMMTDVPGGAPTGGLAKAVEGLKARVIKAYHGSPHDFERFSMEKIGTGEGAQAYGHGLYFAENPQVAADYRKTLAPLARKDPFEKLPDTVRSAALKISGGEYPGPFLDKARTALRNTGDWRTAFESIPKDSAKVIDEYFKANPIPGKTYEVAIHADPEDFLDFDKPIHEQSPKVQEAFRKAGAAESTIQSSAPAGQWYQQATRNRYNAADLFQRGEGELGPLPAAQVSERLKNVGVPGIKYLDQGSRAMKTSYRGDSAYWHAAESIKNSGGTVDDAFRVLRQSYPNAPQGELEGAVMDHFDWRPPQTHNYVVFDDKLIDILKKYGLLLPAAGAATQGQTLISPRGPQ